MTLDVREGFSGPQRIFAPENKGMKGSIENGFSFTELDKAVYDDAHAALTHFNNAEDAESNVWSTLATIFHDYQKALECCGSQASPEELRHARAGYRCLASCVIANQLKNDCDGSKDGSFLSAMIAEDQDFRTIYLLWRWCVDGAVESNGFSDLAHQLSDVRDFSGSVRSGLKRLKSAERIAADPDSILRTSDPNFDKFMRVMFSLLRCGRFDEAVELSEDLCMPWMTLPIRTQQLLIDRSLLPAHLSKRDQLPLHFREVSFQIMAKMVNETKYSVGIRMFFAALVGDWKFLLPFANNFEDRLWCYANAAIQAKLNSSLGLTHPIFTPKSAEGIFDAIITEDTSPYHVLMSFMVRGVWNEAIQWMNEFSQTMEMGDTIHSRSLYRFFGLVASACYVMKLVHEEDHLGDLIENMVNVLREKQLFSHIPFYATILSKQEALQLIRNVMPYIKTARDRCTFIDSLKEAGLDGECIALEFGRFRMLEEVDHINRLNWIFACGDDKLLYAVSEANAIMRYYLLLDMETEANVVLSECESLQIVDRLTRLVRNVEDEEECEFGTAAELVIDEFNNHRLYLDWGRTEQLKTLRGRFYAKILYMFLRCLEMYEDVDVALKLLPVLADDDLKIYEDLTGDDLSQFLLDVHTLAGHLLG
ncbi:hypothetical protein KIN20_025256 [Parelaphostrongylus tenuis]|uniref:Nuclear pore complex protein n=1 Tax=Parelaphostrongylus tenuis TaxID=148309 RepID=A0AAD5MUX6_PARTN|nr:hypothetical protein KIN20_025256 [Parelaphostrongylus tenuis]